MGATHGKQGKFKVPRSRFKVFGAPGVSGLIPVTSADLSLVIGHLSFVFVVGSWYLVVRRSTFTERSLPTAGPAPFLFL
jgi:hypothetical protein